ncbi:MAG: family 10 glycosylhydrolase [Sandaracinaceae bacterium]|nr:family 10 glycosylhydrolase [Sandaracinaceae bacterium]
MRWRYVQGQAPLLSPSAWSKRLFSFFPLVMACGSSAPPDGSNQNHEDSSLDASPTDSSLDALDSSIDSPTDASNMAQDGFVPNDAPSSDLVEVSHPREMRGVWVATVFNLDFPSRSGLAPNAAREELEQIVERVARTGLNAIFFQVRPESDALYASTIEPWSRFLSGTQGRDPGYDPLAILIELAHARGIEVHAWLNPYRGLANASTPTAPNHPTRTLSAHAIRYDSMVIMDPGAEAVRNHVRMVIEDIASRYDIDGIHFDDYFYPYPDSSRTPFPDDASYNAYLASGGTLSRSDWRRENVNALIRGVYEDLRRNHPDVRFGVSPFGIYRPGMPPGIRGLDAYETIYCDAPRWLRENWLDYLAPQLYWPTTQTAQAFEPLARWWSERADIHENLFIGHALHRLGSSPAWTVAEIETQVRIVREIGTSSPLKGSLFFRYRQIAQNTLGITNAMERLYSRPALPPPIPRLSSTRVSPPIVEREGRSIRLSHPTPRGLRAYTLYRRTSGQWVLVRIIPPTERTITLEAGEWALASVLKGAIESQGVRIVLE